jgi:large subunit ribosomal protein L25
MEISAKKREILGKKNRKLRKQGLLPGVIFSSDSSIGKKEVLNITLALDEFKKAYKEAGTSALLKLTLGDQPKLNVLVTDVQVDPMTLAPIHVSFFEVNMKEEIETEVPVNVINIDEHELVKSGEGIVITLLSAISVKCLPANIPHEFTVDALTLKAVGDVLTAADLKVDTSKVELLVEPEEAIVKLDFAQQLETEEDGPADVSAVEVTTAKEPKEGEAADSEEDSKDKE